MDLYKKTEQFVIDSFSKIGKESQVPHFKRTVFWIKELNSQADKALIIAAMAHDIERAFRKEDMKEKRKKVNTDGVEFFRPHEERGAEIIGEFLEKEGAGKELVARVKMLVSRHEEGGNNDQNLLKDADSVSFFENNVPVFLKKDENFDREKSQRKFDWMYNRITSEKTKLITKPWYEKAVKDLNNL